MGYLVESLDEGHGFEVLVPPELVRNPFAGLPRIVEVEHGGHGIDAQAVYVVLVEPEEGVGDEEIDHFVPAVIEDQVPQSRCSPWRGFACS